MKNVKRKLVEKTQDFHAWMRFILMYRLAELKVYRWEKANPWATDEMVINMFDEIMNDYGYETQQKF